MSSNSCDRDSLAILRQNLTGFVSWMSGPRPGILDELKQIGNDRFNRYIQLAVTNCESMPIYWLIYACINHFQNRFHWKPSFSYHSVAFRLTVNNSRVLALSETWISPLIICYFTLLQQCKMNRHGKIAGAIHKRPTSMTSDRDSSINKRTYVPIGS